MEHAQFVALLDVLPLLDGDLAGADLVHADADEGHQPDLGVIRLDEDDTPGRQCREVSLRDGDAGGVNLHGRVARVFHQRLAEVGAVLDEGALDLAGHGRVPAVVGQGGKEGLVDGGTGKLLRERIVR